MRIVILEIGAVALTRYIHRIGKTSLRQVVNLGPIEIFVNLLKKKTFIK